MKKEIFIEFDDDLKAYNRWGEPEILREFQSLLNNHYELTTQMNNLVSNTGTMILSHKRTELEKKLKEWRLNYELFFKKYINGKYINGKD